MDCLFFCRYTRATRVQFDVLQLIQQGNGWHQVCIWITLCWKEKMKCYQFAKSKSTVNRPHESIWLGAANLCQTFPLRWVLPVLRESRLKRDATGNLLLSSTVSFNSQICVILPNAFSKVVMTKLWSCGKYALDGVSRRYSVMVLCTAWLGIQIRPLLFLLLQCEFYIIRLVNSSRLSNKAEHEKPPNNNKNPHIQSPRTVLLPQVVFFSTRLFWYQLYLRIHSKLFFRSCGFLLF